MPLRIGLAIGILSLLVAAGCGSSSSSSSTTTSSKASSSTTGAVAVDLGTTKAGKVLVGPSGRTLYLFEKDSGSTSKCSGECATDWPPLTTTGKPSAGTGVTGNMLGTTMRSDGKEQVTYNGHPLYYFEGDKKSGTIAGQGVAAFGAEWYTVGSNGAKVEKGEKGDDSSKSGSSSSSDDSGGSSSSSGGSGGSSY
jgi:predicted lipoprotein with Yx(FWY)xxD motif